MVFQNVENDQMEGERDKLEANEVSDQGGPFCFPEYAVCF